MTDRLRVGLAGLGFGFAHLAAYRALADRFDVVAVCDLNEAKRATARRAFDVAHGVTDFEALLDTEGIDVIDICTPPALHAPMAEQALQRGRQVICEKPLAGSLAEVDALVAIEQESAGSLMPIFQYRFGNGVARLRAVLDAGVAGRRFVASVETFWRRGPEYFESEWRGRLETELGGVCAMHAIHAHDLLMSLLGPVRSVHARTATLVNDVETEDCAAVTLAFASGALATSAATLGSARERSRLRLHFEHLSAESSLASYEPGSEPWTFEPATPEAAGAIDRALAGFVPGPALLEGQLIAFHDALSAGAPLPVTTADARASVELLTAIYYSAATGEAVELPLSARHPAYGGWR